MPTPNGKESRIIARFHPQAWQRDYAIDVDAEGETDFDVTTEVCQLGREKALAITDNAYDSDDLRHAETAPEWIQKWSGPFYIEVRDSIRGYFNQ
ncbi:MAG: hypothetical protein C5B59_07050 [Bacteroidetes bacterium]|nr:MAG: hypothetical protein C5B59_07050 [Bacteroidota bacterium]